MINPFELFIESDEAKKRREALEKEFWRGQLWAHINLCLVCAFIFICYLIKTNLGIHFGIYWK